MHVHMLLFLLFVGLITADGEGLTTLPESTGDLGERDFNDVNRPEGGELAGFEDPDQGRYFLAVVESHQEEVLELRPTHQLFRADANLRAPRITGSFLPGIASRPPKSSVGKFYGRSLQAYSQIALSNFPIQLFQSPIDLLMRNPIELLGVSQAPLEQLELDNQVTAAPYLEKTTKVTCAAENKVFLSTKYATIPNVDSLYDCQLICQLYSNPAIILGCKSPTKEDGPACLGASFNRLDGRCSFFSSMSGIAAVEGIDSAPVACTSETFVVPETVFYALQNDTTVADCLASSSLLGVISPLADGLVPGLHSALSSTDLESFSGQQSSEWRKSLDTFLSGVWPTWDSTLQPFSDESNNQTSIWRYNPMIPNELQGEVSVGQIFQPHELSFSPIENPLGGPLWSLPVGVKDWRECALLCAANNITCEAWTYLFDPLTYQSALGGCHLSTSASAVLDSVPSSMQTVAGTKLTQFPESLFGDLKLPTATTSAIAETPPLTCRNDRGVIYATRQDPHVLEIGAASTKHCIDQCLATEDCAGIQYITADILSKSARLYGVQTLPCMLLFSNNSTIRWPQKVFATDPSVLSSVIKCEDVTQLMTLNVTSPMLVEADKEMLDDAIYYSGNGIGTGGANDLVADDGCLFSGLSFIGDLIEGANVYDNTTDVQCSHNCLSTPDCVGWSLGAWKSCYLYKSVRKLIPDAEVSSGSQNKTSCAVPRTATSNTVRGLMNCTEVVRHTVLTKGVVLANITARIAQGLTSEDCFRKCRGTTGCNFISYVENHETDAYIQAACLLLARGTNPSQVSGSLTTAANCDVPFDTIRFSNDTWLDKYVTIDWGLFGFISGASVGAASLIGGGILLLQRYRGAKATDGDVTTTRRPQDSSGSDSTEVEIEYGEDTVSFIDPQTAKSRNAFGMNLLENGDTPELSGDELEQALTTTVDDFETMEAKSTGSRLKLKRVL